MADFRKPRPTVLVIKSNFDRLKANDTNEFQRFIQKEIKKFDKFPLTIASIEDWPKKINLLCWNCTLKIHDRPWPIPSGIDTYCNNDSVVSTLNLPQKKTIREKNKNLMIGVDGIACSFACAITYVRMYDDYSKRQNLENTLKFIYRLLFNKTVLLIQTGPTKNQLLQYGGNCTEDEFRRKIEIIERNMIVANALPSLTNC
jgi:hypothetical protein